jgi:Bacterial regulatory proteins, tetR family
MDLLVAPMIDQQELSLRRREADQQLLQGFLPTQVTLGDGARKVLAARLRARCIAVDSVLQGGPRTPLKAIADRIGVSERTLNLQFRSKEALFAFPPPEMASVFANAAFGSSSWQGLDTQVRARFEALDTNIIGKNLLFQLAKLHEQHPELYASDAYFAAELRTQLGAFGDQIRPQALFGVGSFTDCLRHVIVEWAAVSEPATNIIERLVTVLSSQSLP